ncbi:MAG: hypothetical protein J5933_05900, partial [Clostridia bacterium]|nr:hypothetical protein [Clostridia bacterium]
MFKIRKLLILTVLFVVVGIISGCSTEMLYGEDDERGYKPMSAEQFAEFDAYFNGHDRTQSSFLAAMIGD